jgi:hypothetical protein
MGKRSGSEEQVVRTEPWSDAQKRAMNQGWKAAGSILDTPTSYFPGSTVAGMSDPTMAALSRLEGMGLSGGADLAAARAQNMRTINGEFLGSNPYLQGAIEAAQRPTMQAYQTATAPQTDSAFARAGRYGSGGHQNAVGQNQERLARALSDSANSLSYADYGAERGRMQQATGMAPSFEQAGYLGPQMALQAGQLRDQQSQRQLSDEVARYQYGQEEPYMRLSRYMPLVMGGAGQSQTQSTPTSYNPLSQLLGAGLAGAGIYNMLGSGAASGLASMAPSALGSTIAGMTLPFAISDERAKEDVRRVGKTDSGQPIYTYKYKGDPSGVTHMGVMAQELKGDNRKALRGAGGLLGVDYEEID